MASAIFIVHHFSCYAIIKKALFFYTLFLAPGQALPAYAEASAGRGHR